MIITTARVESIAHVLGREDLLSLDFTEPQINRLFQLAGRTDGIPAEDLPRLLLDLEEGP